MDYLSGYPGGANRTHEFIRKGNSPGNLCVVTSAPPPGKSHCRNDDPCGKNRKYGKEFPGPVSLFEHTLFTHIQDHDVALVIPTKELPATENRGGPTGFLENFPC